MVYKYKYKKVAKPIDRPLISLDNKPQKDPKTGRFITGNSGGGRPAGSRPKLSEAFIAALHEEFLKHGAAAISKLRKNEPAKFLTLVANLLPRQASMDLHISSTLFDGAKDYLAAYRLAKSYLGIGEEKLQIEDRSEDR